MGDCGDVVQYSPSWPMAAPDTVVEEVPACRDGLDATIYDMSEYAKPWDKLMSEGIDIPDLGDLPFRKDFVADLVDMNIFHYDLENSGLNDWFAVKYEGYLDIPEAGSWTFGTESDDGSMLYIDDVLVVDNNGSHGTQLVKSRPFELNSGMHRFRAEYFDAMGNANMKVFMQGPSQEWWGRINADRFHRGDCEAVGSTIAEQAAEPEKKEIPTWATYEKPEGWTTEPGLNAIFFTTYATNFGNVMLKGTTLEDLEPVHFQTVPNLDQDNGMGKLWDSDYVDQIAIIFEGDIQIPEAGKWKFSTKSDDGTLLYIDGQMVVDNDGFHYGQEAKVGDVELDEGQHHFRVEYFDGHGDSNIQVKWAGPGFDDYEIIPPYAFTH